MPAKEGPYHIRGTTEMQDIPPHEQSGDWGEPMLPIGLVREFQVSPESERTESRSRWETQTPASTCDKGSRVSCADAGHSDSWTQQ